MKLYNIILGFISIVTAALCSCDLETYDNGKLDGMWRLTGIDTLETSGSKNMDGTKLYWSFQGKLLQMDDKNNVEQKFLLRFEKNDSSLRLYDPYIYDRENGDKPLSDPKMLAPYGINSLEENCKLDYLGSSNMTLKTKTLRLSFKKI